MIFRKHISGLLACLLLLSNSGFAFSIHYCGGQIAAITSGLASGDVCEMPTEEKSCCEQPADHKPCCEDKMVDLEKSDDVVIKNFSFELTAPFIVPFNSVTQFYSDAVLPKESVGTYYHQSHSPPLFQLYSQYIFYA
ncbi:MAG: hypothetical protein ITG00_05325 [Flavobacterium sp.]|nr:hypothetical protein [Flavobacterium sp.]